MNSNITIKIAPANSKYKISPFIYGHFVEHIGNCIYDGLYVGADSKIPNTDGVRDDIIAHLKEIKIPLLRWPGGCFADSYHWMDGIGPPEKRPVREIRQWGEKIKWGGSTETNQFGTHNFFNLCELLNCEPYLALNVGTGSVDETHQWLEYITSKEESCLVNLRKDNGRTNPWKLKFVGVGNESWGCGGRMTADYYVAELKKYKNHIYNHADNDLYKVACGADETDYNWTETLMKKASDQINGLSLHNYCFTKLTSNEITNEQWLEIMNQALFIDELLTNHSQIMDKYDPDKRIGLVFDEWGTWHEADPNTDHKLLSQQSTICDAMVAAVILNILNNHCDRVKMANIAQLINVLHCLIKTRGDKLALTPTFHVYNMYKYHQGAEKLETTLHGKKLASEDIPTLSVSGSRDNQGTVTITVCNPNPALDQKATILLEESPINSAEAMILTAEKNNAENTFEQQNNVSSQNFNTFQIEDTNQIELIIPRKSIIAFRIK